MCNIFCINCRFYKHSGGALGGSDPKCLQIYERENYIRKYNIKYGDPKEINKDGNCIHYKRIWWHFWAEKERNKILEHQV